MLSAEFSESWFNGRHVLIGNVLRPLCLWHFAYLQFVDSPLIPQFKKMPPPGWADLEQASRICRLEYEHKISDEVSIRDKARLFICMARSTLDDQIKKWQDYFNDYFAAPKFNQWKSLRAPHPRGTPPDALAVASACLTMLGGSPQSEKYVWEMPIGKAYWYSSAFHFNNGTPLDFVTAKDEAMRNKLKLMRFKGEI